MLNVSLNGHILFLMYRLKKPNNKKNPLWAEKISYQSVKNGI